jgi:site-specific recombinase XerD
MPSGIRYWTVLDSGWSVVPAADEFLRHVRFGRDGAELTTKAYAHGIALYLRWCTRTGRAWPVAAADLGLFITWLKHAPADVSGVEAVDGGQVLAGPGVEPVRGASRINKVLAAVRGFLSHAITAGQAPAEVLELLYELADDRSLPTAARGEWTGLSYRLRARHRLVEPERPVDRAADEEIVDLLRSCRSCRDRLLIVLLMARAGLRRGELAGLRREDIHFMVDSAPLGCQVPGAHLHVVRRDNVNGAWAKSRRQRAVPVDFLVVQAYDQYVFERAECPQAESSDFVLVNLFRQPLGTPMPPDALGDLITSLASRAGLNRRVTAHMLRHAYGSNVVDAGGTLDEVQELLGHASMSSTQVYMHPAPARTHPAARLRPAATDQGDQPGPALPPRHRRHVPAAGCGDDEPADPLGPDRRPVRPDDQVRDRDPDPVGADRGDPAPLPAEQPDAPDPRPCWRSAGRSAASSWPATCATGICNARSTRG